MTWILVGAGALVGVGLLAALIGSFLPSDHTAQAVIHLAAPPDRVWALVSDFAATPRWRRDVRAVQMEPHADGRVRFVETTKQGKTPFEVIAQHSLAQQAVRVVDDGLPFGGTWTWDLARAGNGTRLTITEQGFIRNPVFRLASRLLFKPTATIERYLLAAAKALNESAEPVIVRER